MTRILFPSALLAVLVSCSQFQKQAPTDQLPVTGRVEADEIDLAFKLPGRIVEITVREGDPVKKGQLIARLSGSQEKAKLDEAEARYRSAQAKVQQTKLSIATLEERLRASQIQIEQSVIDSQPRVDQSRAQVASLKAELARAKADEDQTISDADRYTKLAAKGAIPQQTAEQYASRVKTARATVEAAEKQIAAAESFVRLTEANLENPKVRRAEAETTRRQIDETRAAVKLAEQDVAAQKAALDRAKDDVAELEIYSPADGTVITRSVEPGRVIAAGQTVITMVNMDSLYVRAFVPEGQIGLVKLAQRAQVFLDSSPNAPLEAEVMRIDPQAMFTPENTYFKDDRVKQVVGVKLRIKGNTGSAKVGMPADAVISLKG